MNTICEGGGATPAVVLAPNRCRALWLSCLTPPRHLMYPS